MMNDLFSDSIIWELPLKTVSEANCSEHWTIKSKRHRQQQFFIRSIFAKEKKEITLPCTVYMVRLSPRLLDDDNLLSAFKWIRDEISECLLPDKKKVYLTKNGKIRKVYGRCDDDPRIKWIYGQAKSKKTGIRIEIKCQAI